MFDTYRPSDFAVTIIFLQLMVCVTVFFDIPIVRQLLGFLLLTFVPGFAILHILKVKLELASKIAYAAGLSLAFLMGVGFLTNLLGPLVGVFEPLSLVPLMVVINAFVVLLMFFTWRDRVVYAFSGGYRRLAVPSVVIGLIFLLCMAGTLLVNAPPQDNNFFLLLMLVLISVFVGFTVFSKRLVNPSYYPLILFSVAAVLLLHVTLFSSFIHGGDIFGEYASLKLTLDSSYWNPALASSLYSMLSVTILPTIYSTILGLNANWVLKIVYPSFFALVPVGLFALFKSKMSKEVAFFSVFFFISVPIFFTEINVLARQMIGELFYVLLFLTVFGKDFKGFVKWLLFCTFSFGLVVSHYAISYIFLAFIFSLWLFGALRKRKMPVDFRMVIAFATMTFVWYIYTSSSTTFNYLLQIGETIRTNFITDFFSPQSRGSQVLQGTGLQSGIETFWHIIGRYLYLATEFLIVFGLLSLALRRKRSFFDDGYNVASFFNMLLLIACIVVPNFAGTFNISRFYQVTLFFLAPFAVLGALDILSFLSRKRLAEKKILAIIVLAVLIPFFLFQTDFVYEAAKEESISLPLSSYRFNTLTLAQSGIIKESEVAGAVWLTQSGNLTRRVNADIMSAYIFNYVGGPNGAWLSLGEPLMNGSYVYLRNHNILEGVVFTNYGLTS